LSLIAQEGRYAERESRRRSADDLRVILGGYGDIRVTVMERLPPATLENDMPMSPTNRNH